MVKIYIGPGDNVQLGDLRVWHIPQIPGKPFYVNVDSIEEGERVIDILADYDIFQFENRIKPDYSNASGIERWEFVGDEEDSEEGWFEVDVEFEMDRW